MLEEILDLITTLATIGTLLVSIGNFIVSFVGCFVSLGALFIIGIQSWLMRQSNYATAYKVAFDILQEQKIRDARKYVFDKLKNKPLDRWDEKDTAEAEKVCQSYDSIGQMVRRKMIPKEYIVRNWLVGLRDSWDILEPFVQQLRIDRDFPDNWDDYEFLATEAKLAYAKQKTDLR